MMRGPHDPRGVLNASIEMSSEDDSGMEYLHLSIAM
jgi:hypothetical protein